MQDTKEANSKVGEIGELCIAFTLPDEPESDGDEPTGLENGGMSAERPSTPVSPALKLLPSTRLSGARRLLQVDLKRPLPPMRLERWRATRRRRRRSGNKSTTETTMCLRI